MFFSPIVLVNSAHTVETVVSLTLSKGSYTLCIQMFKRFLKKKYFCNNNALEKYSYSPLKYI